MPTGVSLLSFAWGLAGTIDRRALCNVRTLASAAGVPWQRSPACIRLFGFAQEGRKDRLGERILGQLLEGRLIPEPLTGYKLAFFRNVSPHPDDDEDEREETEAGKVALGAQPLGGCGPGWQRHGAAIPGVRGPEATGKLA